MTAKKAATRVTAAPQEEAPITDEKIEDAPEEAQKYPEDPDTGTPEVDEEAEPALTEEAPITDGEEPSTGPSSFLVPEGFIEVRPGGGKAAVMRDKLMAQPKVAIMIPLAQGEARGSTESVILNGYRMNILKGMYVHVPMQVARVIMESQQQTQQAINNYFLMDGSGVSPAMRTQGITSA